MKYEKAVREGLLKTFTLIPIGWGDERFNEYEGVLKYTRGSLKFQILNGLEELLNTNTMDLSNQKFHIVFRPNPNVFNTQHATLQWMKTHKTFYKLIENSEYNVRHSVTSVDFDKLR